MKAPMVKAMVEAVLYAIAEQRVGPIARTWQMWYTPSTGVCVVPRPR